MGRIDRVSAAASSLDVAAIMLKAAASVTFSVRITRMKPGAGLLVIERGVRREERNANGAVARIGDAGTLSLRAALKRYRGVEGILWPALQEGLIELECGLASLSDAAAVRSYVRELPQDIQCDVIAVVRGCDIPSTLQVGQVLGIDVGFLETEWSNFSVIWNAVAFGTNQDLHRFSGRLNASLLLTDPQDARDLLRAYQALQEAGVEDGAEIDSEMECLTIMSCSLT